MLRVLRGTLDGINIMMRCDYYRLFYLWPSDHHQAGSHLTHHLADQQGFAYTWRPHQKHPSGTGYTERAQCAWIEKWQLQHLSKWCRHLKCCKKNKQTNKPNKQSKSPHTLGAVQWERKCCKVSFKLIHLLQPPQLHRVPLLQLTPVMSECLDASNLNSSLRGDESSTIRLWTYAFNNNIFDLCVEILQVY